MGTTTFALSSRRKIERAEEHLKTLDDEITAWAKAVPSPCAMNKVCSPDGTTYTFFIDINKQPPLDRWADCAHNLRSSLDNLIYAFAIRDTGIDPPAKFDKLQFPIADSPEKFKEKRYQISTLSPTTQAAIEHVQPFNRLHTELPPLMSLVRDFNNVDKHRLLNVVVTNVQQGHIVYEYTGNGLPAVQLGYNPGPNRKRVADRASLGGPAATQHDLHI
jgi:hypothetical protein